MAETLEQKNARQAEVIERLQADNQVLRDEVTALQWMIAELARQANELRKEK